MFNNNCEINILVKNRLITEYAHRGQTFIEGRPGSSYEIEFVNKNSFDVEVILSVDGLSVTDGKEAGENSRGYMVCAYNSVRVPGWTLDNSQAASFVFNPMKGGSYVEQIGADSTNKGVIGALVYARKKPIVASWIPPVYPRNDQWFHSSSDTYQPFGSAYAASANLRSFNAAASSTTTTDAMQQTLGTAFGPATSFKTTDVSFERGYMTCMMVLYYDDQRGLKSRGIVMGKANTTPQAFPGLSKGCAPPVGWQG